MKPALRDLNQLGIGSFCEEVKGKVKVRAFTRLGTVDFSHQFTSLGREMSLWTLRAPKMKPPEILLAGVHLPSKIGGSDDTDQITIAKEVIEELYDQEDFFNHRNTAMVGDFNMNPYDRGMTSVTGVHGLMTETLARLPDRNHRRRFRRRFYNPMWGLFGDRTPGPAGTYRWRSSVLHNPHWSIFDQVLVRPALVGSLSALQILEHDGKHSLLSPEGIPDKQYVSDHLPILFQLDV